MQLLTICAAAYKTSSYPICYLSFRLTQGLEFKNMSDLCILLLQGRIIGGQKGSVYSVCAAADLFLFVQRAELEGIKLQPQHCHRSRIMEMVVAFTAT